MIKFNSSSEPTIGVEIELQLVDNKNLNLKNISKKILSNIKKEFSDNIKCELIESMIEINTNICSNIEDVEQDIKKTLTYLTEILNDYETDINCTSLHPFAIGKKQIITENLRYKRIMKELQMVGKRFISQGLHIHIGINDPEDAIKVNNALRIYLPLLLALTTSSPFFEGEDTGLHSYRTKLFEALPLAGMPDYLINWNHFENLTEQLEEAGIIHSVKDLWWDVRPHPGFGTVEIRVCDIPITFKEIIAIVALVQALVVTLINAEPIPDTHIQILQSNKWQAARYGLEGVFVDPKTFKKLTIRKAIENFFLLVEPTMLSLGSKKYFKILEGILNDYTGSTKQRNLYNRSKNFQYVIKDLKEKFYI
ncbi:MAG TPA: YbdK family carboxylate-amine ligase [Candidatus Pelagibacter bacterium]|jgi:carboxylate-amine ligase|nr:YbdK family carboxylate-amine ligase [Candidatus Pelagibacter bacterium]|tara:strand:+ start:250 stop:1347 length:1098 start_codon:yes stop_codon:yes gene_type:complete